MHEVRKGDCFTWENSVAIKVVRVAEDNTWADIACWSYSDFGTGTTWTKRQSLPFPGNWIPQEEKKSAAESG